MIEQFTIVDEHTHTYPTYEKAKKILNSFTTFYKMEPTHLGKGTIEEVISNMQRDGVDYTILANFAPLKILHENNLWTLAVSHQKNNLVPLISIHPEMDGNILNFLKEYKERGAKGIKIHPSAQGFSPNDPRNIPIVLTHMFQ